MSARPVDIDYARAAAESRAQQGLPPRITDRRVLAAVALELAGIPVRPSADTRPELEQ